MVVIMSCIQGLFGYKWEDRYYMMGVTQHMDRCWEVVMAELSILLSQYGSMDVICKIIKELPTNPKPTIYYTSNDTILSEHYNCNECQQSFLHCIQLGGFPQNSTYHPPPLTEPQHTPQHPLSSPHNNHNPHEHILLNIDNMTLEWLRPNKHGTLKLIQHTPLSHITPSNISHDHIHSQYIEYTNQFLQSQNEINKQIETVNELIHVPNVDENVLIRAKSKLSDLKTKKQHLLYSFDRYSFWIELLELPIHI